MPVSVDIENPQAPPASISAEEDVMSHLLMDPLSQPEIFDSLKADQFYGVQTRDAYQAARTMYLRGDSVDLHSLSVELESLGKESNHWLSDLTSEYHRDVKMQIRLIKDLSLIRQFHIRFSQHMRDVYTPGVNAKDLLLSAEKDLYNLLVGDQPTNTVPMSDMLDQTVEELLSVQESANGVTGIPSGLDYDQITSGWQKGEFYIIAGRPGMGKTAFVLQNLKAAASQINVGLCSMEMGSKSLIIRILLAEAGVDTWKARSGRLNDSEKQRVREAKQRLSDLGIILDDTTDMDPSRLRIKARMMKQRYDIGLLAVDYLQLMKADNDSREQQVAEISRTCKLLSKELDIPVLGLSQLSRKPDDRRGWGTRPQLGDLRESGALEQDCDVAMFLYRPEEYGLDTYPDGSSTEGITEVIVDKHRNGPTGTKKLLFVKEHMSFENLQVNPVGPAPEPHWLDNEIEPF